MRHTAPLTRHDPGAEAVGTGAAGRSGDNIDAWLDAALAEQAERAARRDAAAPQPAPAPPPPAPAAETATASPAMADSLRSFEQRIKDLSTQFAAPRPIGRRGLSARQELGHAVAEIRQHQARLSAGTAVARVLDPAASPAPAAPARSYDEAVAEMRAEIARLADRPALPVTVDVSGEVMREIASLRDATTTLARRDEVESLERSVRTLAAEIAGIRQEGGPLDAARQAVDALDARIAGLAPAETDLDRARLSRNIDVLSHKLDIMAASGIEADAMADLSGQLEEMRGLMSGVAVGTDIALLGQQVIELRREVAAIGQAQIDPADLVSLKTAVEAVRDRLTETDLAPIRAMLVGLDGRFDRIDRQANSDYELLSGLERQMAGVAALLARAPAPDQNVVALQQAMHTMLTEVANWREGTIEVAEQAARSAVVEALQQWSATSAPAASIDMDTVSRHLSALDLRYASQENRTDERLEVLGRAVEGVVARMAAAASEAAATPSTAMSDRAAPAAAPSAAQEASASGHVQEEILLEPGALRPTQPGAVSSTPANTADIKSSFIAAARRAAQAAQAETAEKRPGAPAAERAPKPVKIKPPRSASDKRRPLLVGAAAVALAIGSFQLVRDIAVTAPDGGAMLDLAPTRAPGQTARVVVPDPQTTQSIGDAPVATEAAPAALPPTAAQEPASVQAEIPAAPSAETSRQASIDLALPPIARTPAPSPDGSAPGGLAALRSAVTSGNTSAQFELASRLSEGRGVPRDLVAAAALFEKAAEKGLAPAQYRVGNNYEKGLGVGRDLEQAKSWYRRAADSGNNRAMHNYAVLLAEGAGAKPDYAAAAIWFAKAAEVGVRDSQYNLAVLNARGLGVAQDLGKSYLWFAVAAAQGDDDAAKKRDEVGGRMAPADLAKAKASVERWRPAPGLAAANEVPVNAAWSIDAAARSRAARS